MALDYSFLRFGLCIQVSLEFMMKLIAQYWK